MMKFDFNELMAFEEDGASLLSYLEASTDRLASILGRIREGGDFLGWVGLPPVKAPAEDIARYVASLPPSIEFAVIMGIGGSSLGPRALYTAAYHPMQLMEGWKPEGGRRLFFLDNSDPDTVAALLDGLDPEKTLYAAITKSGSTAETAAQLMIAWDRAQRALGPKAAAHFVFVTDPEKGDLRTIARSAGVRAFDVPPHVGGRYSVLCPVGLLPAALAGIDPLAVLAGAEAVRARCLDPDLMGNPAALLGASAFLLDTEFGRDIHVLMPYSDRLADTGAWFAQLWAESLGKSGPDGAVGPTPLSARGATDQHSLLQLLRDGPKNKFVTFVDVAERRALPVPEIFGELGSFAYLGGHGMEELISCERLGTQRSLALAGVPTLGITVDEVNAGSTAALMYLLEVATAVAGFLYKINPFDQPGVEESKRFSHALMGRPGLDEVRKEIEGSAGARDETWILEV
jgi:glucose-6-phosphate isomerase